MQRTRRLIPIREVGRQAGEEANGLHIDLLRNLYAAATGLLFQLKDEPGGGKLHFVSNALALPWETTCAYQPLVNLD